MCVCQFAFQLSGLCNPVYFMCSSHGCFWCSCGNVAMFKSKVLTNDKQDKHDDKNDDKYDKDD